MNPARLALGFVLCAGLALAQLPSSSFEESVSDESISDIKIDIFPKRIVTVEPDQRVELKCVILTPRKSLNAIKWSRGQKDESLHPGQQQRNGVLVISQAKFEDAGEYKCTVGELSQSAFVFVGHSRQCPAQWIPSNLSCYLPVKSSPKSWSRAQSHCGSLGANLVDMRNSKEQEIIDALMSNGQYWIGLKDVAGLGQWTWNLTEIPFVGIQDDLGRPKGDELCTVSTIRSGDKLELLQPHTCDDKLPSICRKRLQGRKTCPTGFRSTGSLCLKVIRESKNYMAARAMCSKFGSSLLYFTDSSDFTREELSFIKQLIFERSDTNEIIRRNQFWTGIRFHLRLFQWGYEDFEKTIPDYVRWASDEPKISRDPETSCVAAKLGEWRVLDCGQRKPFVCKKSMGRYLPPANSGSSSSSEAWNQLQEALTVQDKMRDQPNKGRWDSSSEDSSSSSDSSANADDPWDSDSDSSSDEDRRRGRRWWPSTAMAYFPSFLASWSGLTLVGVVLTVLVLVILIMTSVLVSRSYARRAVAKQRYMSQLSKAGAGDCKIKYERLQDQPSCEPTEI